MNNRHWEFASAPIAAVYKAHPVRYVFEKKGTTGPNVWKPGGHIRIVLEDMELSTEVITSALENAKNPPFGLPCPECIAAAEALLQLDEPGRFYAVQHYHYPNSTLSYGDWLAMSEEPAPDGLRW